MHNSVIFFNFQRDVLLCTNLNHCGQAAFTSSERVVQDDFCFLLDQRPVRTLSTMLTINAVPAVSVSPSALKNQAVFEFVTSSVSLNNTYICEVQPWSGDKSILQYPFFFPTRIPWQECEETSSLWNFLLKFYILQINFL